MKKLLILIPFLAACDPVNIRPTEMRQVLSKAEIACSKYMGVTRVQMSETVENELITDRFNFYCEDGTIVVHTGGLDESTKP